MAPAGEQAARNREGGIEILAGRLLFGVTTLLVALAVVGWDALGKPWGPGTSAALAYGLFAIHLALLFRRLSPMDPLVWTPLALLLFYFGEAVVIEWLRLPAAGGYDPWQAGNADFVERGFAASVVAVAAFLAGIHIAGVRPLAGDPRREPMQDRSFGPTALLFALGAVGLVVAGIAIVGPSTVFGYYSDWWDAKLLGLADERFIDIGMVFANAGVYALLATDEPGARWRRWFAYLLMPVLMLIAIQKGDRTGLIALGVGAGWCYTQRIARVRWPTVIVAAVMALVLMPVIVEWRRERSLDESKQTRVVELLGKSVYSMGTSVNALVYTLELVPSQGDHTWGTTFRLAVLRGIPNFGFSKGKEWARGELSETPSAWLAWVINPWWFSTGGGYGYSMAAEWYYNFGLPGIVFGMAFTGWGMARVRNKARNSSLALIWSATLFAGMAVWTRNILGHPFKVAVWPPVGLWLIHRLLLVLRGRAARRPLTQAPPDPVTS